MSDSTALDAHKATASRFTEIINSRDFDAFPEVCQPNLVRHCPATPDVRVRSLEDMVAFLEEGKIAEIWVTWDNMGILAQLGHLPSPGSGE